MKTPKVLFITGAGRGVGIDLATAALAAGHSVVATAQDAAAITLEVGEHERLLALAMVRLQISSCATRQERRHY